MGNAETKSSAEPKNEDFLRDSGVCIPANISIIQKIPCTTVRHMQRDMATCLISRDVNLKALQPTSNWLLAYADGNYYPCVILDRAKKILNGYSVFFFHNQTETEIPCNNVIGNFKALLDCKVSFTIDGITYTGKIIDMGSNDKNEITNFFVSSGDQCAWVSLPFMFLSVGQARQLI